MRPLLFRSVGSQLDAFVPATRLSTLRLLVAVDVHHALALLCGGPKGPGLGGRPSPPPSSLTSSSSSGGGDGGLSAATDAHYRRVFGDGAATDGFVRLRVVLEALLAAQVLPTSARAHLHWVEGSGSIGDSHGRYPRRPPLLRQRTFEPRVVSWWLFLYRCTSRWSSPGTSFTAGTPWRPKRRRQTRRPGPQRFRPSQGVRARRSSATSASTSFPTRTFSCGFFSRFPFFSLSPPLFFVAASEL